MLTSPGCLVWVDIAKAISIVLVIMMYATYNTGEYTGDVGFMHYAIAFATPFRMPEFFLPPACSYPMQSSDLGADMRTGASCTNSTLSVMGIHHDRPKRGGQR
jgi:hypothetical protein